MHLFKIKWLSCIFKYCELLHITCCIRWTILHITVRLSHYFSIVFPTFYVPWLAVFPTLFTVYAPTQLKSIWFWHPILDNVLKVTLDPVQPSRAKANWLIGQTTRSTLTALHTLCPDTSPPWLCSPLWIWLTVREQDCGFVSIVLRLLTPFSIRVSGCFVPRFFSSLKMEKHLSKRSMFEEGWAGPVLDSR